MLFLTAFKFHVWQLALAILPEGARAINELAGFLGAHAADELAMLQDVHAAPGL